MPAPETQDPVAQDSIAQHHAASVPDKPSLLTTFAVYAEPKVLAILFLGFSSGIPLGLTGQTLSVWLKEEGLSLGAIGLFALVGLPYVLKFLWAPFIDALKIPLLTRLLGRRRAWLILTQGALIGAILGLGASDPAQAPLAIAALALLVAFCSASQDIVIDAFRIESLEETRFAAGMANYVAGYRVANLVSTAGAFELAGTLQGAGLAGNAGWAGAYAVMAAFVLIGTGAVLFSAEPLDGDSDSAAPALERLRRHVIAPVLDFLSRPQWLAVLLFVMLFKFSDAIAGVMTAPFVLDLGFEKQDYGRVVKIFGFLATLLGGFVGGGIYRGLSQSLSLWLAGILQMLSNLMFVWLARAGADYALLVLTIGVENIAGGLGTVIFVAYLSGLCRNRDFTATQYALLSALAALGRTVLSAPSGQLAEWLDWEGFFALSAALALPGLALLWYLTWPSRAASAKAGAPGA
jgi:PAT family beta-lactamase induction signal transducer AmpG